MFRTTVKNLAARKLRLLTTSLAVLLGVAFMAGTLVLTDTISRTFDGLFTEVNAGTDAYVRGKTAFDSDFGDQRQRLDASVVDAVRGVEGVAVAEGSVQGFAQVVDKKGNPIGDPNMGAPTFGANWGDDDDLNPFELAEGRAPKADDEVVIDRATAKAGKFSLGDAATVLTQAGPIREHVVGIATFGGADSPAGASFALFTEEAAQKYVTEPGKVDAVKVVGEHGVDDAELVTRIQAVVPYGAEVLTGAEITAEDQSSVEEGLGFFNTFMLAFAFIALFVGSFIIYNSFSILVAQRGREMALLRAIGASRRQVLGSVLIEAIVVGTIASLVGLGAGIGVAALLKALLAHLGIDIPAGGVVLGARTVVMSFVAGLGVTVAAAFFPARRASKVPPIAAMRDLAVDESGGSRRRAVAGLAVTGLGALLMASGLFAGGAISSVGIGATLVFVGVAVLGPILARPLSRVIGAPLPRLRGMPGTLARENALRNPKRTSATAAALMIGVALVGFITILASSTKSSVAAAVESSFTGDLVVDSGSFGIGGLDPDLAGQLAGLPELAAVSGLRMAPVKVDGSGVLLPAVDPTTIERIIDLGVTGGSVEDLGANEIAVLDDTAKDKGWRLGTTVPVLFAETGEQPMTVAAIYTEKELAGEYLVGLPAFEANVADQFDIQVLMTAADGVSLDEARAAVERVTAGYPQAEVRDRQEYVDGQTEEVDAILNLIYALLSLAVIIALLGIANTLALSLFERTRELGLLRAVGMTRRQLRTTVRWESVIIALLGTTLGLVIGIGFGWAIVKALEDEGLTEFTVPGGQLLVVAGIAAVAGVVAAILPARRAARLDVLNAIVAV
ncbi:MAG TPA: FtsX-like permease family protein [Acidimicrobiales bacterium]|nr:FtsX-like permease family protein [Acidimicrobiales bacterium]